jgi:hypothetical protein
MYDHNDDATSAGRKALMGALSLYLNFINLFMLMLRLAGKIAGASRYRGGINSGRQTGLSNIETGPDAIRGACGPSNDRGASSSGCAHAADSQRPHLLSPQQPLLDDRPPRRR